MTFTILKLAGGDAVRVLNEQRSRYVSTMEYPFLIGDSEMLQWVRQRAESNRQDSINTIQAALDFDVAKWIVERQIEAEENEWTIDEMSGEWPGEIREKGSIGLHKDIISGKLKPEVFFGLAKIEKPWHLPALLQFGGWNECPEPTVQCAIHRQWYDAYGAEITGVSNDVVECAVTRPPRTQAAATALAWDQYWYCKDIVEQGCGDVANLAATLVNSPYWYFWWD